MEHRPSSLALTGTWFIVRSSLPLWRGRDNPSVTYAPLPGNPAQLLDAVRFTQRGRPHLILGTDTLQPGTSGEYVWRGLSPLTRFTSSRWRWLHAEPAWAITLFEATLFTPAGLDVYARTPHLLPLAEQAVWRALEQLPAAQLYLSRLFAPVHHSRHTSADA